MKHELLNRKYWNSKPEIIEAAYHGFNTQQILPKLLKEAFPDFKALKFGFSSLEEATEWQSKGWEPMPLSLFDVEEFNASSIPARFGLTEKNGMIMSRDNILMVRGLDLDRKVRTAQHQRHEDYYEKAVSDRRYVAPEDPRRADMLKVAESKLEEEHRNEPLKADDPRAGIPQKRGPGGPPKKK